MTEVAGTLEGLEVLRILGALGMLGMRVALGALEPGLPASSSGRPLISMSLGSTILTVGIQSCPFSRIRPVHQVSSRTTTPDLLVLKDIDKGSEEDSEELKNNAE